ncbi:MAG: DMT family transporter [Reyranellales bacterium]
MITARPSSLSLGALSTVLAMLGFAGMDAISKWLVADYAIGQMIWIRYGFFCLFAWFVVRRQGLKASFRTRRPWLHTTRALLAVVESAVFVLAFNYLPLADTHAIAATAPLLVVALGVVFLGERAGAARWLAVGASFIGVLLVMRPGFKTFDWPLLLPLLGALLWAAYQILVRLCAREDSPKTTLVWSAFVAFGATTLVGPLQWQWPDPLGWTLLIAIGLLGSLANYAMIKALDFAEAGAVQPYSYTMLVWVTALGFLVFGNIPDNWTLVGAAIIVASSLYAWRLDRRDTALVSVATA